MTGSAAAALKRQSAESGAGRFTGMYLPPLSFFEYLSMKGLSQYEDPGKLTRARLVALTAETNRHFSEYVNFGGFPEVAFSESVREDLERHLRHDVVDKVLAKDLPSLYGITNIRELTHLFNALAFNSGRELSRQKLSNESGVAANTIDRYLEYLEAAFLVKRLYPIKNDGRRFNRRPAFKVYLTNPTMRAALFGPTSPDEDDFDHVVETALLAQWRVLEGQLGQIVYLKGTGRSSREIDFIELGDGRRPTGVMEIKWSDRIVDHPAEWRHVTAFAKKFGIPRVWFGTRTVDRTAQEDGVEIHFVPVANWALMVGAKLIPGEWRGDADGSGRIED